jgi:polyphosphate kinase
LIEREIRHATQGGDAQLLFKMNSLTDPAQIRVLYRASQAGVKIRLIIRGTCGLRPGIPGISENIEVISIVGRFLEHSRIYCFANGGEEEIYLGSADLMQRNLDRRVEVIFPVLDARLRRRLRDEILGSYLADTVKARRMGRDGSYSKRRKSGSKAGFNAQEALLSKTKTTDAGRPRMTIRSDEA